MGETARCLAGTAGRSCRLASTLSPVLLILPSTCPAHLRIPPRLDPYRSRTNVACSPIAPAMNPASTSSGVNG
jgi:hypothetical protein